MFCIYPKIPAEIYSAFSPGILLCISTELLPEFLQRVPLRVLLAFDKKFRLFSDIILATALEVPLEITRDIFLEIFTEVQVSLRVFFQGFLLAYVNKFLRELI